MESERLILRMFEESDAEDIYELAKDPDVGPRAGWPMHTSVENSREIIRNILRVERNYAIVLKESGKVIGAIGLSKDPLRKHDGKMMLGYWIGKPYWGCGYMVEAANCIMRYGFEECQLPMISVHHYDFNTQSKRVIEKLGFAYEGTLHQAEYIENRGYVDYVCYYMTKEMYQKHQ